MSPMVRPRRIGVTVGLTAEEVKHIRRQVVAKEPIDVNHISVLRGAAVQIREGLAKQLLLSPALLIYFAGQSLPGGIQSVIDVMMIVLLLGMVVLLGISSRQFHQTVSFSPLRTPRDPTTRSDRVVRPSRHRMPGNSGAGGARRTKTEYKIGREPPQRRCWHSSREGAPTFSYGPASS